MDILFTHFGAHTVLWGPVLVGLRHYLVTFHGAAAARPARAFVPSPTHAPSRPRAAARSPQPPQPAPQPELRRSRSHSCALELTMRADAAHAHIANIARA